MQEKANILIVDDEQQMLLAMEAVLARAGHIITKAENGQAALEILSKNKFDLMISDMKMPVMTGIELLQQAKQLYPQLPVVMITAYGTINQAVEVMKSGAFDFITKPFSAEDLEGVLSRVFTPVKRNAPLSTKENSVTKVDKAIITNDPAFKRVLEITAAVAQSAASVLVQGESGTGKELVSRFIHSASPRNTKPFVAVNCAALPDNLLESELFGHEKGSFTGAVGTKIGKFELADGGTILLDEISEMDLGLQAKLLRVLQEREIDRVGGTKPVSVDVRVIATTNRDIRQCVAANKFRADLYYRLNVIPLYIPALRERKGDIRLLLEHFVRQYGQAGLKKLSAELVTKLESYDWPGNIRELQNACERAVLLALDGDLKHEHFMLGSMKERVLEPQDESLTLYPGLSVADAERKLINETLRSTNNNKTKAAELLGISIRTLRNKLHEYNMDDAAEN
ncbi:MAG: sigma-54-dependent Fis family transcriptional regulator [Deltaproteobacteria bacterium]|nr:sigma-54-dependent Fis family transcriptional regulator [Deltaproteobacteria bacterium]